MEKWIRSPPHREWWQSFLKNSVGTGFWQETYFMGAGMEPIYDDVKKPIGFQAFAPGLPRGDRPFPHVGGLAAGAMCQDSPMACQRPNSIDAHPAARAMC